MKLWIVLIIYMAVGVVNIFLWLLYFRITVADESIYDMDDEYNFAVVMLYVFTGITLPVILLFYVCRFIKKYMIALIETIVVLKENEDDKDNN